MTPPSSLTDKERIAKVEEQNKHQDKDIGAIWDELSKQGRCIRRIERGQWIVMAKMVAVLGFLAYVVYKGGL